jgi:glycosyltransferase involved in cell wall biosynthesis
MSGICSTVRSSMTATTTVSAVIPVHNGERYVAEAVRSVLSQTRPPIDCIVIDDGSTDASAEAVRAFADEITYVRQDRGGVSQARNRGAELGRGELVAFLDHDDAWLPDKLARQLAALEGHDSTMALCAMAVVDAAGHPIGEKRLRVREELITGMLTFDGTETVSCSSTGVIRRSRFLALGGFDPGLSMSADWDLLLRVLLSGAITYVDEPLVRYRVHGGNMSRNISALEHDMTYAFAKAFADARLPIDLRRRERYAYGRLYRMLAGSYRDAGDTIAACRMAAAAVGKDPRIGLELFRRLR